VTDTADGDVLPTWLEPYRLALGDEHTRSRAWTGVLHRATLTLAGPESELTVDLLDPKVLELPARFWQIPERARRALRPETGEAPWIKLAHVAMFVPLGWIMARSLPRRSPVRSYVGLAILAMVASVILELGKLGFEGRHPNLWHGIPDTCGALLGAALHRRWKKKRPPHLDEARGSLSKPRR